MIEFIGDKAIVSFEVVGSRREIRMPLSDYLALVKCSTTLEELRARIMTWGQRCSKTATA